MVDILFITRPSAATDSGSGDLYEDIRLSIDGKTATLPILRSLADGKIISETAQSTQKKDFSSEVFPVLTPVYLEEFFRKRGITFQEIMSFEDEIDNVKDCLRKGVGVIAICTTWISGSGAADGLRNVASRLRHLAPHTPIVVGGVNVRKGLKINQLFNERKITGVFPEWFENTPFIRSVANRLLLRGLSKHFLLSEPKPDGCFDALITCNGGEETLASLVKLVKEGKDFRSLPNLAIPNGDGFIFTPSVLESVDIDSELVDWSRYSSRHNWVEFPIRSGTGCPFKCGFCDFQGLQNIHFRSTESLVEELKTIPTKGGEPNKIYFIDDNLGLNRKRLVDFAKAIIKEKLNIRWRAFLRADVIDQETASLLKESGCYETLLGIESGDADQLRNMDKRLDPEKALKGIWALDQAGIRTLNTFVVGYPGECARSTQITADFISAIPSGKNTSVFHRFYLFRFMVSPLSPAASVKQRKKFGLEGIGERWKHDTMDAAEAKEAMRDIFLKVKGISHIYLEQLPAGWPDSTIKNIMEMRDRTKKGLLLGEDSHSVEPLIQAVKEADQNAQTRHSGQMKSSNVLVTQPADMLSLSEMPS